MKKSLGALREPLFPLPVLLIATYDSDGTPNIMTMTWGGITCSGKVTLNMRHHRKTIQNIRATQAFSVSTATTAHIREADYCGLLSGLDTPDKVARSGFHVTKAAAANAPVIDELPLTIVCKLEKVVPEEPTLHITGEVVDVLVEEDALTADGEVDASKLDGVVLDIFSRSYVAIGEKIADAWSVGKELHA